MSGVNSEHGLETFEQWLKRQIEDTSALTQDALASWREVFDELEKSRTSTPKVGLIKLPPIAPGEYRYAVAIRDDAGLWLTLWVKRTKRGEFFVLIPRADRDWDAHASYHLDGTFHSKSFGKKFDHRRKQPLTGTFQGTEHLGAYGGHGASIGAICNPDDYSGVVEVAPDALGPYAGAVFVDLVEPGHEPIPADFRQVVQTKIFKDFCPNVAIRITS